MENQDKLPARLREIVEDLQLAEGREKLEMLLEYAEQMPPLPEHLQATPGQMDLVEECMTPVYVYGELDAGRLKFFFNVPKESPTVRGYAALLGEGLYDSTPEQVLKIPADFYAEMGLHQVLTTQRLQGIGAILAYMKQIALKYVEDQRP
jgi:cysteine desulfuration protein SufE